MTSLVKMGELAPVTCPKGPFAPSALFVFTQGLLHTLSSECCPQACHWAGLATPGSLLPCRLTPQQLKQNLHLTRFPGDLHALSSLRGSVSDTSILPCPTFKTVFSLLWFSCLHPPALLKVANFKGVWQLRLWDTKIEDHSR